MAIRHLRDGENFGDHPSHFSKDFGFSKSADGYDSKSTAAPPFAADRPTHGDPHEGGGTEGIDRYARGGNVDQNTVGNPGSGGSTEGVNRYAHGGHMHPHGHHVVSVRHHEDGRVVHHHAHGGHTVHHPDGHISHHESDGSFAYTPHQGEPMMDDKGGGDTYVERMRHGGHHERRMAEGGAADAGLDRGEAAIRASADVNPRDNAEEGFARGGRMASLPRGMKPTVERHHSPIGREMPINKPPRDPNRTTTPRNAMPEGQMGYGVEPSAEPDAAGSEQGIPQMRHGGHSRHRR